ncbi:T9SS type B sorting domain-containing protein [Gramella sp. KN1008]|uniref:T9SS type B sorting domain-containing protein n=1 Tax=Gramella sp. KN1008 TaxID=2529298 RepID=UPI00103BFFDF|nr:T9SS type B sorting domain-containing protein [Gramella sp. KN1008]TBW29136.1 T9SS type B sorting domain-containing protein [Gramella sp. KN1008]
MRFYILLLCLCCGLPVKAQLSFCNGSKGDPIFHEDFGSGSGLGEELPAGVTNYNFVERGPGDGEYTVADLSYGLNSWHQNSPNTAISNGRALIVNADFSAGRFYRREVTGLCENTTYEFSAFLMNVYDRSSGVCINGGIPINVRFEIWDETDTLLLKEGNTGDISSTSSPNWKQYALTFSSEPGQDKVILKMFNNGDGGCGNDLAIDDIIFRSCGDLTTISSNIGSDGVFAVCEEDTPVGISLEAIPDNSVYEQHFFQWQESSDGTDWQDIPGATSETFEDNIAFTTYFRVKVAEDAVNLSSNVCSSASEPFQVEVIKTPQAPVSKGDIIICSDDDIPPLSVSGGINEKVYWYDAPSGGNLLAEDTFTFTATSSGTYYAEARKVGFECEGSPRTKISLTINEVPAVNDEVIPICLDTTITLDAGISGQQYIWDSGETSQSIMIDSPGTYSVEITNQSNCSSIKIFTVEEAPDAEISKVISEEGSVTIIPEFQGEFLYSIDGVNYQRSNSFDYLPGGIYTAYIKDLADCKTDSQEFPHIVVPKFISPNNDGYNDSFELKGVEYFESSEIIIFDRYGKLIKAGRGEDFIWNGEFQGIDLPADDYWYVIRIVGFKDRKGHFSLIR